MLLIVNGFYFLDMSFGKIKTVLKLKYSYVCISNVRTLTIEIPNVKLTVQFCTLFCKNDWFWRGRRTGRRQPKRKKKRGELIPRRIRISVSSLVYIPLQKNYFTVLSVISIIKKQKQHKKQAKKL